jgi:hypothetical protein
MPEHQDIWRSDLEGQMEAKRNRSHAIVGISVLVSLALIGCGGGNKYLPELGQVHGVVTLDGKPIEGIVVQFNPIVSTTTPEPTERGRKRVASGGSSGVTDKNGEYRLTFDGSTAGAEVGPHDVKVVDIPPAEADDSKIVRKPRIPLKYLVGNPLRFEVEPGDNSFDIALKSK